MKLTKDIRNTICDDLMQRRFSDDYLVLVNNAKDLANKVYNDVFSETDQKKMDSLPKGWLPSTTALSVKFGGSHISLHFDGHIKHWISQYSIKNQYHPNVRIKSVERLVPYKFNSCGVYAKVYDARHQLSDEYTELYNQVIEFHAIAGATRLKLTASLNSVTTDTKLVESWPEVRPFIEKLGKVDIPLPAIPTADLNAALRLP